MLYEQAIQSPYKPFLFQAALNYFSSYLASIMGFSELFATLKKYVKDEQKLWRQCMRVKRGGFLCLFFFFFKNVNKYNNLKKL